MDLLPVATFSLDGWVFTPKEKLDNLFLHFVSANKSQSVTAKEYTYSYQYILATWQGSPQKLIEDLTTALNSYFGGGYFKSVEAAVNVKPSSTKGDAYDLEIFLEVKDEYGKTFNLNKILQDFTSKSSKWVNQNNYGDPNQYAHQE